MKRIWAMICRVPFSAIVWMTVFFQSLHVLDEFQRDWSGTDPLILLFWSKKLAPGLVGYGVGLTKFGIGVLSVVSFVVFFRLVYTCLPRIRGLVLVVYGFIFLFYFSLLSYLYSLEIPFDYSILSMNVNTIMDKDFLLAAMPYVRTGPLVLFVLCLGLLYRHGIKFNRFIEHVQTYRVWRVIGMWICYLSFIWLPFISYDPVLNFFKSAKSYCYLKLQDPIYSVSDYTLIQEEFVYNKLPFPVDKGSKPNVLIVMVESFNSFFVESKDPEGRVFTPNLNALIQEGFYVEHFYGNSVQSCKGQFATLTSLIPPIYGFGFRHYFKTRFKTITQIFHDNGYYNVFFQASGNLLADNTKNFLERHFFDDVKSARQFTDEEDDAFIYGWGLQDRRLYHYFFDYYDQVIKPKGTPFFAVLPTIYTHNNTIQTPKKDRHFYPEANKPFEYFSNVVHLTDRHFEVLLEKLEERGLLDNTILIITGDHSRSAISDTKVSFNQTGFNDDIFQVPFLLFWKGVVLPQRVTDVAYSQVDIAPTLVDLIGLDVNRHHFQGVSMFENKKDHSVFLVQPYNGIYLGVVKLPYKYGKNLETGQNFLFNVIEDPFEEDNLYGKHRDVSDQLEAQLGTIFQTNALIKSNKVWR